MKYKIMAYDNTYEDVILGVEATWRYGAWLFGASFQKVVAATSWDDILNAVVAAKAEDPSREVELQVWGHGAQGAPIIGKYAANAADIRWSKVASVWFRSCLVAGGVKGLSFMETLAKQCRVAAHTVIIGANWGAASYLYGLEKGGKPTWPSITLNVDPVKPLSSPAAPRTVMFWDMNLPEWAFDTHTGGKPLPALKLVDNVHRLLTPYGVVTHGIPVSTSPSDGEINFTPNKGVYAGRMHTIRILATEAKPATLTVMTNLMDLQKRADGKTRFAIAVPKTLSSEVTKLATEHGITVITGFKDDVRLASLILSWKGKD